LLPALVSLFVEPVLFFFLALQNFQLLSLLLVFGLKFLLDLSVALSAALLPKFNL
jgi:hypothetical protein